MMAGTVLSMMAIAIALRCGSTAATPADLTSTLLVDAVVIHCRTVAPVSVNATPTLLVDANGGIKSRTITATRIDGDCTLTTGADVVHPGTVEPTPKHATPNPMVRAIAAHYRTVTHAPSDTTATLTAARRPTLDVNHTFLGMERAELPHVDTNPTVQRLNLASWVSATPEYRPTSSQLVFGARRARPRLAASGHAKGAGFPEVGFRRVAALRVTVDRGFDGFWAG